MFSLRSCPTSCSASQSFRRKSIHEDRPPFRKAADLFLLPTISLTEALFSAFATGLV